MDMHDGLPTQQTPDGRDERPDPEPCVDCGVQLMPQKSTTGRWYPPPERCERCDRRFEIRRHRDDQRKQGCVAAWRNAEIPEVHASDVDEEYRWPDRIEEARKMLLGTPPGGGQWPCAIYLHGPVGSGKSTLAVKLLRAYLRHWRVEADERLAEWGDDYEPDWERATAKYVNLPTLLADKKESFDGGERVDFRDYREADFLILDDLGRESPSTSGTWAADQIYTLAQYRYTNRLPTVYTSNYGIEGLPDGNAIERQGRTYTNYGDRSVSRIAQMCGSSVGNLWEIELRGNHRMGGAS